MNTEQNSAVTVIPVKLTINSRHVLSTMGSGSYTMFPGNHPASPISSAETEPEEEILEEMEKEARHQMQTLFDSLDTESDEDAQEMEKDVMNRMEEMFRVLFQPSEPEDNSNRYILTTEGTMEIDETEYRLKYTENPDNGFGDAPTILHIPKAGGSVLIERTGTLMSTLYCEKGRRHMSNYTSPMLPMPFSVCIYTRKCEVNLTAGGGVILLDYLVELRGADIQRTTMRINVSVLPSHPLF